MMKLHNVLTPFISIAILFASQFVHADCSNANESKLGYRDALTHLQKANSHEMLKAVESAVEQNCDDGLNIFLSMLLRHRNNWANELSIPEKKKLFSLLNISAENSSLQSQFFLAKHSRDYEKKLLELASNKYAPASLHLSKIYFNKNRKDNLDRRQNISKGLKFLNQAAENGSVAAAFDLGAKLLNIDGEGYGCNKRDCPPKDIKRGWYWMQVAAKHANEYNLVLGDFSYEIGNLYLTGLDGSKPDFKQAYLWYLLSFNSVRYSISDSKLINKINLIKKSKHLKIIAPQLDTAWGNATKMDDLLRSKKQLEFPQLYKKIQTKRDSVVFSFISRVNSGSIDTELDVFEDGSVVLIHDNVGQIDKAFWKFQPNEVKSFLDKLAKIDFYTWPASKAYSDACFSNKCQKSAYQFVAKAKGSSEKSVVLSGLHEDIGSWLKPKKSNQKLSQLMTLIEQYFPIKKQQCTFVDLSTTDLCK